MKISEVIKELELLKEQHGDVDVFEGCCGNYMPIKRVHLVDRGMGEGDLFVNLEPDTTYSLT